MTKYTAKKALETNMKLAEWLKDEDKLKGAEIFAAVITIAAGGIWVYLDGFTGETIAQVTATLGTALIIIMTFLYKMKQQRIGDYTAAGTVALEKLQRAYPKILSGPRFFKGRNNEEPDEEKNIGKKYLFFQKQGIGEIAQFIPTTPLEMADIEIYVSRKSLRILDIPMDKQEEIKSAVRSAIYEYAKSRYDGLFVLVDPKSSDKNLGIKLDFIDEVNSLSYKKFEKIVFELGQKAIETLLTHKMS
ncbi:MAG: hypothetical protein AABY50_10235 [Nitrospirota bacterium]